MLMNEKQMLEYDKKLLNYDIAQIDKKKDIRCSIIQSSIFHSEHLIIKKRCSWSVLAVIITNTLIIL